MTVTVFAGSQAYGWGVPLSRALKAPCVTATAAHHPDGTAYVAVTPPDERWLNGRTVVLVQSLYPRPQTRIFELLLMAEMARRFGAAALLLLVPYLPYAREDRPIQGRSIGMRVVADLLRSCRADGMIAVDVHSRRSEELLGAGLRLVTHNDVFGELRHDPVFRSLRVDAVLSPDLGSSTRANAFARSIAAEAFEAEKKRAHRSRHVQLSVENGRQLFGRRVAIVDDATITGRTLVAAAGLVEACGGTVVGTVVTHWHPLGIPPSSLGATFASDSLAGDAKRIRRVSLLPCLADAIEQWIQDHDERTHPVPPAGPQSL